MKTKSKGRTRKVGLRIALLLAMATAAPRVGATQSDTEAQYRALVDEAITEYEARNFPEARALFLRAHALSGNARTLRGLGMVAFELRNYADSVERLEQALAARERPLDGDLRANTEALLARARAFVAQLELRIEPAVAVQVRIDGTVVALDAQRVRIAVGDHAVEIAAPGFVPERRMVTVVGGETHVLPVQLRKLGERGSANAPSAGQTARAGFTVGARGDALAASDVATPPDGDGDGDSSVLASPWFWTAVVLVVGGGVTAGVLLANAGDEVEAPLPSRSGITVNALEFAP